MLLPAYINVNRNGIPALKSTGMVVSTTQVAFDFNNHRNLGAPFRGLLIINLAQEIPTGTTTTLPIVFTTDGGSAINLTTYDGENITVADLSGTGIYLVWYDNTSDTLQLI